MTLFIIVPLWNLVVVGGNEAYLWVETSEVCDIGLNQGETTWLVLEDTQAVGFVIQTVPVKEQEQVYLTAWALNDEGEYVEHPVRLLILPEKW